MTKGVLHFGYEPPWMAAGVLRLLFHGGFCVKQTLCLKTLRSAEARPP